MPPSSPPLPVPIPPALTTTTANSPTATPSLTPTACSHIAHRFIPSAARLHAVPHQGACSLTFFVVETGPGPQNGNPGDVVRHSVLQFRERRFAVSVGIARAARGVYGSLVPDVVERGWVDVGNEGEGAVQVCEMSVVPGVRFSEARASSEREGVAMGKEMWVVERKYGALMRSLARFFALGWKGGGAGAGLSWCTGKVGSTLLPRLRKLEAELPTEPLRRVARVAREEVEAGGLEALPVGIQHGDLLPENIMVDAGTWEVSGVIDWAEAEYLPFGINLYALEHLLGCAEVKSGGGGGFEYLHCAEALKKEFWTYLRDEIRELNSEAIMRSVGLCRTVGVLLWHGFAWDDGRIDRVVDEKRDVYEMIYLRSFLSSELALAYPKL